MMMMLCVVVFFKMADGNDGLTSKTMETFVIVIFFCVSLVEAEVGRAVDVPLSKQE